MRFAAGQQNMTAVVAIGTGLADRQGKTTAGQFYRALENKKKVVQ